MILPRMLFFCAKANNNGIWETATHAGLVASTKGLDWKNVAATRMVKYNAIMNSCAMLYPFQTRIRDTVKAGRRTLCTEGMWVGYLAGGISSIGGRSLVGARWELCRRG